MTPDNAQMGTDIGKPTDTLIDPYGRRVDYLRVSVTDRCDFRCVYCMAEEMTFLPCNRHCLLYTSPSPRD